MLSDLYCPLYIFREEVIDEDAQPFDKEKEWKYNHKEDGFIQPRSGGYPQVNQRNSSLSTHVLYTYADDVDIVTGDRISFGSLVYQVEFVQQNGIGAICDHQEIDLSVLDDLDYSDDLS
jgi:hypothetical protein